MDPEKRATLLQVLDDSPHGGILAARLRVTEDTLCAGCGETMEDEFFDNEFDGVMTSKLEPFHHGCEDE